MKKIIFLLLFIAELMTASLMGCGGKEGSSDPGNAGTNFFPVITQ